MYLGYLNAYPDHWTQGESLAELRENLADLYGMFADKTIPGIRQVAELEVEPGIPLLLDSWLNRAPFLFLET